MDKQEIIDLMDEFINDKLLWNEFKEWVYIRGYTVEELGFEEE